MASDTKSAESMTANLLEKTEAKRENGAPRRLEVDASAVTVSYANFCRVTGTPEEVLLDFGLNTHPFGQSPEPIKLDQRIVVNYYTAKRMLAALQLTVQRHEAAFGVLETDVQKRIRPSSKPGRSEE